MTNKTELTKRRHDYPWENIFYKVVSRCISPNDKDYKYYGGRGIKCLITKDKIQTLWFRDKAYLLKQPSIDRKDNNGNYRFDNCRFIERVNNSIKAHIVSILQYDKNMNFIKEWKSLIDVEKTLKISHGNISQVARGHRKYAGKFVWRYKYV